MDQKILESLTALINKTATWQLVLTAIVSLLTAFIGAYVGTLMRAKAQRAAARQDFEEVLGEQIRTTFETESVKNAATRAAARKHFEEVLGEQIRTTFETESVKNAIASAASHSLEKFRTDLQQQTSSVAFWRDRVSKLKDMAFESALAVHVLTENCKSVPWMAKKSLEEIHEPGHSATARIRYALVQLHQLGIIDQKSVINGSLGYAFQHFVGAVALYKEQIALGNIELTGSANASAKHADDHLEYRSREWRQRLDELDTVISSLALTADPVPTGQTTGPSDVTAPD
jgi:hypothetical protein